MQNRLTVRTQRAIQAWTLLGVAAYVLLPWYFLQRGSLWSALPGLFGGTVSGNGLTQAVSHGRFWLWSGFAGLLLAGAGTFLTAGRRQGGVLVAGALLGLVGLGLGGDRKSVV